MSPPQFGQSISSHGAPTSTETLTPTLTQYFHITCDTIVGYTVSMASATISHIFLLWYAAAASPYYLKLFAFL